MDGGDGLQIIHKMVKQSFIKVALLISLWSCVENSNENTILKDSIIKDTNGLSLEELAYCKLINKNVDEAIKLYERAIQNTPLSNRLKLAELNVGLGGCYFENNDIEKSISILRKGLNYFKDFSLNIIIDNYYWSSGYLLLANCYRISELNDSALTLLNDVHKKISIYTKHYNLVKYDFLFAEIHTWKARIFFDIGDYEKSMIENIEAIKIYEKKNEFSCYAADNYSQLGKIFLINEELEKSEKYYLKALKILKTCYGDTSLIYGRMLTELGLALYEMKKFKDALICFESTHNILSNNNLAHELEFAYSYNNLGDTYCKLGDFSKGIEYYDLALAFFTKNSLIKESCVVYHNLGNTYSSLDSNLLAEYYYLKAIELYSYNNIENSIYPAYTYQRLGRLYLKQMKYVEAKISFASAIKKLYIKSCDSNYNNIKSLRKGIISKTELYRAHYYMGLAGLLSYDGLGNITYLEEAIKSFQKAIQLQDMIRSYYTSEQAKLYLGSLSKPLNENYLKALLEINLQEKELQYENEILEVIERSKYSTLRSLLHSTKYNLTNGLDQSKLLIIDGLNKKIRFYENIIEGEISQLNQKASINAEDKLFSSIFSLDTLINSLRNESEDYFNNTSGSCYYSIDDIKKVLSDSVGIIDYFFGDSLIVICAINSKTFKICHFNIDSCFRNKLEGFVKSIQFSDISSLIDFGYYFYSQLIAPITPIIENLSTIIIVPDDVLYKIPFELLIKTSKPGEYNIEYQDFLIKSYNISYQYSINLMIDKLIVKNQTDKSSSLKNHFSGFAPLGDPQVEGNKCESKIVHLPYSKREIASIADLFIRNGKNAIYYANTHSSEDNVVKNLENSRIVHLATHGYTNGELLNHKIILSANNLEKDMEMFVNSSFYNFNDGYLTLSEVYNLDVNSDLVTLSLCASGKGNYLSGEGTKSLAQGFYFSGANNILFTLWEISDEHTYNFMIIFYSFINQGFSYSQALRKTKIELLNSTSQLPVFWAGFLIIG
jgi:CHAT domain-containing protein